MKKRIIIVFILMWLMAGPSFAQTGNKILTSKVFKDAMGSFVTDSFNHNMGTIPATFRKLVKYFKYTGKDTVFIARTWTTDPHFICEYPKEPLVSGKIYPFTVCFTFTNKQGPFSKTMGFYLSNRQLITYKFEGMVKSD